MIRISTSIVILATTLCCTATKQPPILGTPSAALTVWIDDGAARPQLQVTLTGDKSAVRPIPSALDYLHISSSAGTAIGYEAVPPPSDEIYMGQESQVFLFPSGLADDTYLIAMKFKDWGMPIVSGAPAVVEKDGTFIARLPYSQKYFSFEEALLCEDSTHLKLRFTEPLVVMTADVFNSSIQVFDSQENPVSCKACGEALDADGRVTGDFIELQCDNKITSPFAIKFGSEIVSRNMRALAIFSPTPKPLGGVRFGVSDSFTDNCAVFTANLGNVY